jgi:hypothetical protein
MTGQSNPSRGKSPVSSPAPSLWQRDFRGLHKRYSTVLSLRAASAAWSDCGAAPCSTYLANERAGVPAPTPRPRLQRPPLDVNSPPQPAGSQATTCGQPSAVLVARLSGCQTKTPPTIHRPVRHCSHLSLDLFLVTTANGAPAAPPTTTRTCTRWARSAATTSR